MKLILLLTMTLICFFSPSSQGQTTNIPNQTTQTYYLRIDPRGTYLFVDWAWDSANPPTTLELLWLYNNPDIRLQEGDLIGFEQIGAFDAGTSAEDNIANLAAVFAGPLGFLFPGPLTTAPSVYTIPTDSRNIPTDIPQDFQIYHNATVYAQVPKGATKVLFTVNDSHFDDNRDPNGDFAIYIKLTIKKPNYRILRTISFMDNNGFIEGENSISFLPSNPSCSVLKPSRVAINFQCVRINSDGTETIEENCSINTYLSNGILNGGHDEQYHTYPKPLGQIIPSEATTEFVTIPKNGLQIIYTAPEQAGEINILLQAFDPYGTQLPIDDLTMHIKVPNLIPLNQITGITFQNISHHPHDGFYGTVDTYNALIGSMSNYKSIATHDFNIPQNNILPIFSEAGSLSWGGQFDIDGNWQTPHCGHRNGDSLDISLSPFTGNYKTELQQALYKGLKANNFKFLVKNESPLNPKANHWHIQLIK